MTFNDLFEKKDLGNNIITLTMNKNFVCPDFEEDFDNGDDLFSMEMKMEDADKFINYLSHRFKSIDRLIKHLEGTYSTSYDGFTDLFYIFAEVDLKKELSLFDFLNIYPVGNTKSYPAVYDFILPIQINNKIHGTVHLKNNLLSLDSSFDIDYIKIYSYNPETSLLINNDNTSLLKQIKIYFL